MHKLKHFTVLEIRTIQLSILSPAGTSDSVFAGEADSFFHSCLDLLSLSTLSHFTLALCHFFKQNV